jgi:L-alanine-DL-glutamate epimerase-like enolase superfamily enzyme
MSGEPCNGGEKPQRPPRRSEKQRAEHQAESIARHWRRAGFPAIKVWIVEEQIADGVGRHWAVRTNLQNGLPPT